MASWQARILKLVFRARYRLRQRDEALNVAEERTDLDALASRFAAGIRSERTPVTANGVPAEWVVPAIPSTGRVVLYLHGGGYVSGSITSHRTLATRIAHAARARALLVDYRLAPEYPFPAALEDALTTYHWLLAEGSAPHQIAFAGDSAGAGLALSALVTLRGAGDPLPAAVVCISPWVDLAASGESWTTKVDSEIVLIPGKLLDSARMYLGDADPRTPLASPLYADLQGLPPVLIQVGSDEILLSDATRLAEQAEAAGVAVTLEVWEGMSHVWHFAASLLPEGRQAIAHIGAFIDRACQTAREGST